MRQIKLLTNYQINISCIVNSFSRQKRIHYIFLLGTIGNDGIDEQLVLVFDDFVFGPDFESEKF